MMGTSSSAICRFAYDFFYINIILYLIVCSNGLVDAAPYRSKNKGRDGPQLVYDQKQTGDYNIQLHLKDFQIIALLGDDTLGDYDYNYDYADFTVKPSGPSSTSTTPKSTFATRPSSTTPKIPSSTSESAFIPPHQESTGNIFAPEVSGSNSNSKPVATVINPYPLEVLIVEPTKQPTDAEDDKIKENKKTDGEDSLNEILNSSSTVVPEIPTDPSSASELLLEASSPTPESMTPGKIKVQILETPSPTVEIASDAIGIVPGEDVLPEVTGGILQGELASYRKCVTGFTRDKKGRCRRVRRPGIASQLPFGFSRIASNLATRLKLPIQSKSAEVPLSAPIEN